MKTESKMITQSTIIEMGWTKSMINNLLPEPILKTNPHYKCAAPMKLWEESTVLQVMETEDFKIALEKANKRKKSAEQAKKTKEKNLMEKMIKLANEVEIPVLSDDELIDRVLEEMESTIKFRMMVDVENYERYGINSREDLEDYENACDEYENFVFHRPGEKTLNRWVVNYIRHRLIDYDYRLRENKGKIGKNEAYPVFKIEILKRIATIYPKYALECNLQIKEVECSYCA
ncbi:MAG: hypothetical protein II304_01145 [Bacteroidales bacterium]|nr:hypothetical protein [Bacteroidales bacterium]